NNANIDIQNSDGDTALMMASQYGNTEIVKLLIENNANIHIKDNNGETALIWALRCGYIKTVKLLIENNANINIHNSDGDTDLMGVLYHGHVVKLLIELNQINDCVNRKIHNKNKNLKLSKINLF